MWWCTYNDVAVDSLRTMSAVWQRGDGDEAVVGESMES